jgi:hypothetical protein
MPAGDFVIPETRNFPVVTPDDIPAAVSSWGRYTGDVSFDEFKRRLIALAKRKGSAFVDALPAEWTQTKSLQNGLDSWGYDGIDQRRQRFCPSPALRGVAMDFLKSFGGAVKAVAPFTVRGRGVVYGGADLTGDTFTKQTDFGESRPFVGMPVYYDHALGSMRGQIGTVKAWTPTDDGIDVEIEIDRRDKYAAEVMKLVKSGALGSAPAHCLTSSSAKTANYKRWIVGEISFDPDTGGAAHYDRS